VYTHTRAYINVYAYIYADIHIYIDVEAVLNERGTKAKREILVKYEGYDMSLASWKLIDAIPAHLIDTFHKTDKWARGDKDNLEKDILKAAQLISPSEASELTRLRKEKQKK